MKSSETSNAQSLSRWQRVLAAIAWLGSAAVVVYGLLWVLAPYHWAADALTSFALQMAACTAIGFVAAILSRSRVARVASTFSVVVTAVIVWPQYQRADADDVASRTTLKVISANVWTPNRDSDALRRLVDNEQPDVLVVLEAGRFWVDVVASWADFPHQVARPREDNFGVVVASRHSLRNVEVVELSTKGVPTVTALIDVGGRPVRLIATHPVPPKHNDYWRDRNEQLRGLADLAAAAKEPLLLIGDLNATPWSPAYKRLLKDGQLRDARRAGRGWMTTWPTTLPLLAVPIDHALERGLAVTDAHVGWPVGSDHRPIVVTVAIEE